MMEYEIHGDMAPKMEAASSIVDQYKEAGVYMSLYIEENNSSTFVATDGELSDKVNALDKGARIHVVGYDQEGMAWEVYGINKDTTKAGLEKLADFAAKTLTSGDSIENISRNFTAAAANGVYLSVPSKIQAYSNDSKAVQDHYEAPTKQTFDAVSDKEKTSLVEKLSESAMKDGIAHSRGIYKETERKTWFADTNGSRLSQVIPRPYAGVSATAQKEDPAYDAPIDFTNFDSFGLGEGGYELVSKALKEKDAIARGSETVDGAIKVLGGARYNSGATTVVMDGEMAGVFIHEALGHMTEADHYIKHDARVLKGKLGEKIGVDGLNVVDDARPLTTGMLSANARGSYKYDDEGTPAQRTEIIKDGTLENYLMGNNEASLYDKRQMAKFMKDQGFGDSTFDLAKEIEKEIKSSVMDFTKAYMDKTDGIKDPSEQQVAMYMMSHQEDMGYQGEMAQELQKIQTGAMGKIQAKQKEIQDAWAKADKHEFASTGNSRAEGWYCVPQVRMTNTMILPNEKGTDLDGMVADVNDGIYMTGSWGGYVELNGNFAFWPKEAYAIEDGKVNYDKPIKGVILMDNTIKALKNISSIGNADTYERFGGTCGKGGQGVPNECAGPAIRLDDIVVQGTPFDKVGHQSIREEIESHNGMYLGPEIEMQGARKVDKLEAPGQKK